MNCQDFEKIIDDLARDQILEATVRASGLAHSEGCRRCAARLADERTLSGGLRALAARAQSLEAPARVEAMLLAALRHPDRATPVTKANQPATTTTPSAAPAVAHLDWRWAAGIAAALSLLLIAFAATRLQTQRGLPGQLASAHDPQPLKILSGFSAQDQRTAPRPTSTVDARGTVPSQLTYLKAQGRTRRGLESGGSSSSSSSSSSSRINRAGVSSETAQPVNALAYASASGGGGIATDFIPLTYGASLGGTDGGHVVRVELPRTALAQFGLPVNAEDSTEPVKADVLLGEDGLARAIRFVR